MSGIFGIFQRNGKEIEEKTVSTMLDTYSYWEPDESNTWQDGKIAFGHTMLWNTPESKYEHLPLKKDAYILTMDARIDNRDELLKELDLPDRHLEEIGDSEFILAVYAKWGEECPTYLLGDFAFAIWDKQKQQVFCARDHVGVKQFYYHLTSDLFVFSNDLKALMIHPDIKEDMDDTAVANYMINRQLCTKRRTFFNKVKKLEAGYSMSVKTDTTNMNCYWCLEESPKVKLSTLEEYTKRLRDLLEESTHCRMRSAYPIASHLSGGLDSSSIAVIAARKLRETNQKLFAFNWLYEPETKEDVKTAEWSYSKDIAEKEGIEHHYVTLDVDEIVTYMRKRDVRYGEHASFWYENIIRKQVQNKGSRTILSGWGGDEFASHPGGALLANMFLKLKWKKLYVSLRNRAKGRGVKRLKSFLSIIYMEIVLRIVPKSIYCKMARSLCSDDTFSFTSKVFKSHLRTEEKKPKTLTMQPYISTKKHMLAYWDHGHLISRVESWTTASREEKIEYVYPLLDKRIVEFMYVVPEEYFNVEGKRRYIFRKAIDDLLNKAIIWDVAKLREKKRVDRLVALQMEAMKILIQKEEHKAVVSKYIDSQKLKQSFNNLDSNENVTREYVLMCMDADVSLSLLFK